MTGQGLHLRASVSSAVDRKRVGRLRMRHAVALAAVTLFLSTSAVTSSPPALAAGPNCGDNQTNLYGRLLSDANFMAGAQADMTVRATDLCGSVSTNANVSAEWVMLQGNNYGSQADDGLAQNGWGKHAGCSCRSFFYEMEKHYNSNNGPVWMGSGALPWGTPDVGSAYVFKTTWHDGASDDNNIHFIFCKSSDNDPPGGNNCTDVAETNWNPQDASWSGAYDSFAGETHYLKSDMPGTQGANAIARYLMARKHQTNPNDEWYSPSGLATCRQTGSSSCGDSYFRYHLDVVSSTRFDIWTCPIDPTDPAC
jgi:hypothetical protein